MTSNSYHFRHKLVFSYLLVLLIVFAALALLMGRGVTSGDAARDTIALVFLLSLVLAVILGSFRAEKFIRPVKDMIRGTQRFAGGEFGHQIRIDSCSELNELAATLNQMAEGLDQKIRGIEIQNQQFKAILASMVEGIIVTDKSGCVVSINPTVERIFAVSPQQAEGRLFLEVIPNNDIADIINAVLTEQRFVSQELSLVWPVHRQFLIDATPVFEQGVTSGCLLVIHDVTEIRRLETMRRDFVANISHELKTPLTSIKGFVETLLGGAIEDKANARHFLRIIQDHANRLSNLIDDLLSLSYLESHAAELKREEVGLKDLVDEVLAGFQAQTRKKRIKPINDLPDSLILNVDREKMTQVLTNLIDNAVKFNRRGGGLKVYSQELEDGVRVTVEDTGAGIPEKDLPRIFERFYRVDKARSRELGGTGLGLSIVKHIIERHGGHVGVTSTAGLGSQFWFNLPS